MTATEKPHVLTTEEKTPALAPAKAATATTAVVTSAPTTPLATSKAASKATSKVTAKTPARKPEKPKAAPVPAPAKKVAKVQPRAVVPAVVKPAAKVAVKVSAKPVAKPKVEKLLKAKKPKLVRDSFTIPKAEYVVLDDLKQRAGKLANAVKKSELIRAGVKALAAMTDAAFLAALRVVPTIKTGRPSKVKTD